MRGVRQPGKDDRLLSELSLEELEAIVEERKRIERARAFADADDTRRFNPITVNAGTGQQAPALPPPTPGPQSPTRVVIPTLGVDWPIIVGDG
jgi:hypothetical protein